MSNRSKSLFKGPNVKHFALVHRSVRDPAANDPESSDGVLKEVSKNKGKGRTKQDLESILGQDGLTGIRPNEGEAATYGVYYDDSAYDYMQHMRVVGETGDDFSATLVEAPRRNDTKGKGRERDPSIAFKEDGVGAEDEEQTYREYLESTVTEDGLRPDMDPALREILEALEDEAYVEEEEDFDGEDADVEEDGASPSKSASRPSRGGGNFLDALLGAGKGEYRDSRHDKDLEELFDDDELQEAEHGAADDPLNATSKTYASLVEKFKKKGAGAGDSDDEFDEDEEDFASEAGDTVAELRAASARRPPRKAAKARSTASSSAFSMSSSSMFRNDGLTTLDDRFDQIEAMYEDDSEEEEDEEPVDLDDLDAGRQDQFNNIMDEFLNKYEILGGKVAPVLGGDSSATGAQKLEQLRDQLDKMSVLEAVKRQNAEERRSKGRGDLEDLWVEDKEEAKRWDVETVLSTYSNLENHPKMLRLQGSLNGSKKKKARKALADDETASEVSSVAPTKIAIDPRTGFPLVLDPTQAGEDDGADSDATMDADELNAYAKRQAVGRNKAETPEEKRARKNEVKAERQARRQEKSSTKNTFAGERKRQIKTSAQQLTQAADVGKGNMRGVEVMKLS